MRASRLLIGVLAVGVLVALGLALAQPELPPQLQPKVEKEGGREAGPRTVIDGKIDLRAGEEGLRRLFAEMPFGRLTNAPIPHAMQIVDGNVFVLYDHYVYKLKGDDLSLLAKVDLRELVTDQERAAAEAREAAEGAAREAAVNKALEVRRLTERKVEQPKPPATTREPGEKPGELKVERPK